MSDGDVKIHVSAEAGSLDGLERMRSELKKLRQEQKELEEAGAKSSGSSIRRQADKLEKNIDREGARRLRIEDEEAKRAKNDPLQKQRANISKGIVEESTARAAGNTDAADVMRADVEIRKEALGLQIKHGMSEKDALTVARNNRQEKEKITKELKEQDALRKAGIGGRGMMRALGSAGLGAVAGEIFSGVVAQFEANELLSNRHSSTEARNQRQFGILNSVRGTSQGMQADIYATQDRISERDLERTKKETENKYSTIKATGKGVAWGMGIGGVLGSVVPGLGTIAGMGIGAGVGGLLEGGIAHFQGKTKLEQHDQDQKQDKEKLKKEKKEVTEKFMAEEGGLDLDKVRQRSKRTLAGSRAAFADDMAKEWISVYRGAVAASGDTKIAKEMADLTVGNDVRDRQAQAGASLVDGRTGGAGIAAAAQWAMNTGGWKEVAAKIEVTNAHFEKSNAADQTVKHSK